MEKNEKNRGLERLSRIKMQKADKNQQSKEMIRW